MRRAFHAKSHIQLVKWQLSLFSWYRQNSKMKQCPRKQLNLRLGGEWFGVPKTTISQHLSKYYIKLEQVDLLSVQCLVKKDEKIIVCCRQLLPQLWGSNMHTYA